jgi:hypothetical protein
MLVPAFNSVDFVAAAYDVRYHNYWDGSCLKRYGRQLPTYFTRHHIGNVTHN